MIEQTFKYRSYPKRIKEILIGGILFFFVLVIITLIIGLNYGSLLFVLIFVALIVLNYFRFKMWARFDLKQLFADKEELKLIYFDKDKLIEKQLNWKDASIKCFETLTVPAEKYLLIRDKGELVFRYYSNKNCSNSEIKELSDSLKAAKNEYS